MDISMCTSYKFKGVNVGLVYGGYCVLLDYKVSDQKEMVATVIELIQGCVFYHDEPYE